MARKFRTYAFTPRNPEKFKGETIPIILKSSWELEFAEHCDKLPSVLTWNYEAVQIPYRDPITGKQKIYIPDFFVEIASRDGVSLHYVFEIKPMHEQHQEHARNQKDSALVARNAAKWGAATQWADRHSAEFHVLNEKDIYGWHESRKPRVHPVKTFSPTYATKPASSPATKRTTPVTNKINEGISRMQNRMKRVSRARSSTKVGKARRTPKA